jgi:hypothetical protein
VVCYGYFNHNSYNDVVPIDPYSVVSFQNFSEEQIAAYKNRSTLLKMEPVRTTTPEQAKIEVLANVGASFPNRDTIDLRIIQDVINKTGHFIDSIDDQPEGAWPLLNSLPAPSDDDRDGMPNAWELANNLNPNDPSDRNQIGKNGYTLLEEYLNGLVEPYVVNLADTTGLLTIEPTGTHSDRFTTRSPVAFFICKGHSDRAVTIHFETSEDCYTSLKIFNSYGEELSVLRNGRITAGNYQVQFDGKNLPQGVYYCQLKTGSYVETKKILFN